MRSQNIFKLSVTVLTLSLPLYAYAANVVDDASAGISNATTTVKDAVKTIGNAAADIGNVASDSAITTKVKTKLAVESDIPLNISVSTTEGVVSITGVVDTKLQAERIIEVTESVAGVKSVNDSKLKVASSDSYFDDAAITMKTKSKIVELTGDKKIAAGNSLHVETTNGIVHIFGQVSAPADIITLKKEIGDIEDVKEVRVNINVVDTKK